MGAPNSHTPTGCVILGGGGHARVIIETLRLSDAIRPLAILDANPALWGKTIDGIPVIGGDDQISRAREMGATAFVIGVGSVGSIGARRHMFEVGSQCGLSVLSVRHPSAIISPTAFLGTGAQILAGAILNTGAVTGSNVILNTRAVVEHDCRLGEYVHIASGAVLAGGVTVGDHTHIGAGAVVRESIRIGTGSLIGAGAVVVKDVPDHVVVVGNPARVLRTQAN